MKNLFTLILSVLTYIGFSQSFTGSHSFGVSGLGLEFANDVVEHNGKYYVAGAYSGALTFGTESVGYGGGNGDGFLAKYGSTGTPDWILQFAGSNNDEVVSNVTVDHAGNIYLTGYFKGINFDADPGQGTSYLSQPSLFLSRDCFIIKLDDEGEYVWGKQISNTLGAANEDATDIEVDASGNVYVSGRFAQADFDPGTGTELIMADGNSDGFLVKLDSDGDYEWVRIFGGTNNDNATGIALDTAGNIYVTGNFEGNIDLDPSSTGTDSKTSSGEDDVFIVKLDNNGDYVWGEAIGGTGSEVPYAIEVTKEGVVFGGFFEETVDFDPGTGTSSSISAGEWDGWLLQLDTAGNHEWDYTFGSTGLDHVRDIHIAGEEVYLTGTYNGTVDFNNGTSSTSTSNGAADFFMVYLDDVGDYQNHVSLGGTAGESNASITVSSAGTIAMTGAFRNTVDMNPFIGLANHTSSGWNDAFITIFAFVTPENPVVQLENSSLTVTEAGQDVSLKATVQYGNANATSATMSFNAALSTGTSEDVVLGTLTQTSTANVTTDTLIFTVTITDDMIEEDNETIAITLSSLTNNATFLADSTFYITILENDPIIDSNVYDLVFNEIMYNPPGSNDNSEFIEIYNGSNVNVDLEGYTISGGIDHTFPEGASIGANSYMVLTNNYSKFLEFYGVAAIKWDSGTLNNSGELLKLSNAIGLTTDSIVYSNTNGWPIDASGNGHSLVLCDPMSDNTEATNWGIAQNDGGVLISGVSVFASPFESNTCPVPPNVYEISDLIAVDGNGVADSVGINCGVEGIAYGTNVAEFGLLQFTLIDAQNNGIAVDGYLPDFEFTEGDSLRVYGTLYQNAGLLSIATDSIVFINADNDLVAPTIVTNLDETTESSLVMLENLSLVNLSDWPVTGSDQLNLTVTDGTNTYKVVIDKETDIDEQIAPGYTFDLVGIGSQLDASSPFTDGYSIRPRYWADFHLDTIPVLNFVETEISVNETDEPFVFNIQIEDGNSSNTTIDIVLMAGGTAIAQTDFIYTTTTLNFEGGISSGTKQLSLGPIDDPFYEGNEQFSLKLVNPINGNNIAMVGGDSILTVTIIDDEINGNDLVINEILYADGGLQFVEIVNNGIESVELEGFTLSSENAIHTFGAFELSVDNIFVLAADEIVNTTFGLFAETSSHLQLASSDKLVLKNDSSITVDSVNYTSDWGGIDMALKIQSLELCDVETDNSMASSWEASNANETANWLFNDIRVRASASESNDCSLVGLSTIPSNAIKIYPNPTTGWLQLESKWNIESLTLFNSLGQVVGQDAFSANLDLSHLPKGIYHLKLEDDKGAYIVYRVERL